MIKLIKLINHLQDTKVGVPFTKHNAEKCVYSDINISENYMISLLRGIPRIQ